MYIFKPHQAIEVITSYLPDNPTIIEVGAFHGFDTMKMAQRWPQGNIHAFEPVPTLFEQLKKSTAHIKHVTCYQYALSNKNTTATFYIAEKPHKPGTPCQAGSLYKPKERLEWSPIKFPHTIKVKTITLPTWAKKNNVDRIDCLWLDTQGHELAILHKAQNMLKKIRVIYTEVGFIEGYENQPKYEHVKTWLEQNGFNEVGRDFENMSDWFFGNVLFVRI